MGISQALKGSIRPPSKSKKRRPKTKNNLVSLVYERPKPVKNKDPFKDPILVVDIQTGEVLHSRLDEILGVSL